MKYVETLFSLGAVTGMRRWRRLGGRGLAILATLGLPACGTAGGPLEPNPPPGPVATVEMFLDASGRRDHALMARLFGTSQGPVGDTGGALGCAIRKAGSWIGLGARCPTAPEVELRMDIIARILEHDAYRIRSEQPVAGRDRPAIRVAVDLERNGRVVDGVPFVVVGVGDGRWLIQEIGLERVTGGPLPRLDGA